jgi:hypothetical protein
VRAHLGVVVAVDRLPPDEHERARAAEGQRVADELPGVDVPRRPAPGEQVGEQRGPPAGQRRRHGRPVVCRAPRARAARREVLGQLRLDPDEPAGHGGRVERHVEVRRPAAVRDGQPLLEPDGGERPEPGDGERERPGPRAPRREGARDQPGRRPRRVHGHGALPRRPQLALRPRGQRRADPRDVGRAQRRDERVGEAHRVRAPGMQRARGHELAQPGGERGAGAGAQVRHHATVPRPAGPRDRRRHAVRALVWAILPDPGEVAQLVEHTTEKHVAAGPQFGPSSPDRTAQEQAERGLAP